MNVNMPKGSDLILEHDFNKFVVDKIEVKGGLKEIRIIRVKMGIS
jgi:hypothetical protein